VLAIGILGGGALGLTELGGPVVTLDATAAGYGPLRIGTDIGGSQRLPAAV